MPFSRSEALGFPRNAGRRYDVDMFNPRLRWIQAWAVLVSVFGAAALFTDSSIAAKSISAGSPAHFYASPTGRPNAVGSESDPWDLATALNAPSSILPRDTLWLLGGTYSGAFTSRLAGTSDAPILVRAVSGQRVTLDGVGSGDRNLLEILGRHTWFVDLEFTNSHPNRRTNEPGPFPQDLTRGSAIGMGDSAGIRLLNLIIHDTSGVGFWSAGVDTEISGCLIYYNGWVGPDGSHGHGIYAQNQTGTKRISDNLVFRNFSHGLHAYTEDGGLDNISVENNAFFGNGEFQLPATGRNLLLGGSNVARDPRVVGNLVYNSFPPIDRPASSFDIGYQAGCSNPTIRDNYVADNSYLVRCSSGTILGNVFYGTLFGVSPTDLPGNVYLSARPTGTRVFVRANAWEPGRANVVIFNWDRRAAVEVDLSSILSPGDVFEVRNAQDFFGPSVVTGTFAGGPVALPMTGLTTAQPVGWAPPPPTGPEFNAFVVRTTRFGRTTARPLPPRPRPIQVPPRRTG